MTGLPDRFVSTAGVVSQSSDFDNDRPVSSCGTGLCSGTVPCISSAGGGIIRLRSKTGENGQERALTGAVDLPKHAYNGVLITVSKNLQKDADKIVTFLEISAGAASHPSTVHF